jgi:hypothetical protein
MKIEIPTEKGQLVQPNKGEFDGNIWASYNMDFISNPGAIRVSPQTTVVYSDLNSTPMIYPTQFVEGAFLDTTVRIWTIADKGVFYTNGSDPSNPSGGFTKDATAGSPTDLNYLTTDAVEWNGSLIVSKDQVISKLTAGTWTASYKSGFLTGTPHPLGRAFNNLLLVGDYSATLGAIVASIDITDSMSATRLIFGKEFQVVWIRSSSNMVYIGCRNTHGGRAVVFVWDGSSENFNYAYKINGSECYAGVIKDEVPYTINERGELLVLSGSAFTQLATLPVFNTDFNLTAGNIGRNGMAIQDNKIHILINASKGSTQTTGYNYLENQLSGIWVYDPKVGLVHRYSITKHVASDINDYGSPVIAPNGYGGSLFTLGKNVGNILIGSVLYTGSGVSSNNELRHCILTILNNDTDTTAKSGYFITPKLIGTGAQENWQKAWLVIKSFLSASSKIVLKYRTLDNTFATWNSPQEGTWYNTNSFTTSVSVSELAVGNEIEIISGEGSGLNAHITNINGTMIVLDETILGASGTLAARAGNWTKCGTDINYQGQEFFKIPLAQNSTWIQFKVVGFFQGKEEIKKLITLSENQLPIK